MTDAGQAEIIREELLLSDQAMRAARALRDLNLRLDALSRLYFSGFHLARALLASEGLEVRTHRGVHPETRLLSPPRPPAPRRSRPEAARACTRRTA